jgi:hypothetical protein
MYSMGTGQMSPYANMDAQAAKGAGINPFSIPFMPSPEAIEQLRQYGVNFPEHLKQNLFLPEPGAQGFFGQHPGVARGIEGALLGAAGTPGAQPGMPEGAGAGIARGLQGGLGVPQYKREYQAAQIAAPFQQAEQLQGMRQAAAQQQATEGLGRMWSTMNDTKEAVAQGQEQSREQIRQMQDASKAQLQQLQDQLKEAQMGPFQQAWRLIQGPQTPESQRQLQGLEHFMTFQGQAAPTAQAADTKAAASEAVERMRTKEQMDALQKRFDDVMKERAAPTYADQLRLTTEYQKWLEDPFQNKDGLEDSPQAWQTFLAMHPNLQQGGASPVPGMNPGGGATLNQPGAQLQGGRNPQYDAILKKAGLPGF